MDVIESASPFLGLDEYKALSLISVEGQRTQLGVRRVVAGQKE